MQLTEILTKSEDRFLTNTEVSVLENFVSSLPLRLTIYRQLQYL
jgi:hypothetical protein